METPDWQAMGSELTKHQPAYTTRRAGAPHPTPPHPCLCQYPGGSFSSPCCSKCHELWGWKEKSTSGAGTDVRQVLPPLQSPEGTCSHTTKMGSNSQSHDRPLVSKWGRGLLRPLLLLAV